MSKEQEPVTVETILEQSDASKASFEGFGRAHAAYYKQLIENEVPMDTADLMAQAMAAQFFAGIFSRPIFTFGSPGEG